MLEYTSHDLKRAIEKGQISRDGVKFLALAENERAYLGSHLSKALRNLPPNKIKMIKGLQRELSRNAELTRQN